MKNTILLTALATCIICLCASCAPVASEQPVTHQPSIIESSNIVGLWQQMQIDETIDDETGITFTSQVPRSRYKCIMADGSYYLLNVGTGDNGEVRTKILHYGTYTIEGDTLQIEHIETCSDVPALNGHDSYVRYNMPDSNTITLYYKFGVATGLPGSNEWNQEVWKRVTMID